MLEKQENSDSDQDIHYGWGTRIDQYNEFML
jgi:hypothetical protein